MRLSLSSLVSLTSILSLLTPLVSAERFIQSTSLNTCQENNNFTASLFDVIFTPNNATVSFNVQAVNTISGNVTFGIDVQVYGYSIITTTLDPCTVDGLTGVCPLNQGTITINSNIQNISSKYLNEIPGIAYGFPDIDALVTVHINTTADPLVSQACLQARLSNGQTVDQKGVGWATAAIAGLGLLASAIVSGLGHSNTAAHMATYALALFGYFQSIAIIGMIATPMPPMVQSWTQNFQWTMGIIEVDFLQTIATWYQTATGGTPATVLNTLTTTSVQVLKRSMDSEIGKRGMGYVNKAWAMTPKVVPRTISTIAARSNYQNVKNSVTGTYVVKGINRVAFRAGMEATNLFLTGLIFFCVFVTFVIIGVLAFKGICELCIKKKWMRGDTFLEFRNGWQIVLKGIMFRMVLIGWPQIATLCLWEFTQVDSPAEVVLAVFFFFGMGATLGFAAWKVFQLAKRSEQMHKNPAYILYSDPSALNKWGFLYVQFRATAYFYILPLLVYSLVKAMFTSLGQPSGQVQAVAFFIIEGIALIAASVIKPWMDKSTNIIGISICAINFFNAICLMFYSNIFGQPALATGIMGILFFIVNAVFALILLIFVTVASILSLVRKNPDARYQPMSDDRASFMKSQTALNTELDALGATARGDGKGGFKGLDLDDDDTESWSSESLRQKEISHATATALPPSTANSANYGNPPRSPINPSAPFLGGASGPPSYRDEPPRNLHQGFAESRPNSDLPLINRAAASSPAPAYGRADSSSSNLGSVFRQQNNASPAGYRSQNNARSVSSVFDIC